jgi:hypothetical protein
MVLPVVIPSEAGNEPERVGGAVEESSITKQRFLDCATG